MQISIPRVGRWSFALTIPALAALAACGDEPIAPKTTALSSANAGVKGAVPVEIVVTNTSGGTDVGSLRWAADQLTQPGGVIKFDATLAGTTITLDAGLE